VARFEQRVKIDAPIDKVWGIISNPATWVQWFPDVDSVSGLAAVQAGSSFQWRNGDESGSGSIETVDENRGLIKVVTTEGDKQISHIFDLDRSGGLFGLGGDDTRLTYQREYDVGHGFLGEFVAGGNPVDLLKVKHTLEKVKDLAEG
jgi:uncharacterized protein YndB with AHSA1/START domain